MSGSASFQSREELLVCRLCLGLVSRQDERSAELQARHCAHGIAENDRRVIENLLEFRGGFGAPVCRH